MGFRNLFRLVLGIGVLALTIVACQGPTRTEYLLEITREVTVVVVVTATPDASISQLPTETAEVVQTVGGAISVTASPSATTTPTVELPTQTPDPTVTPDVFPTPIVSEIVVSEQLFEHGRMFYLQPLDIIWVLVNNDETGTGGVWSFHQDTWEDGMPEFDDALEAEKPDGLFQPIRGFGKLWRESDEIRNALGWAVEEEAGHVTRYQYFAGGEVQQGRYIPGPGTHSVNSRYGGTYIFDEADFTWGLAAVP